MSILTELEALFPTASAAVQTIWHDMVIEEKALVALVAKEAKAVAGVLDTAVAELLPAATAALKAEALACVKALENDPAFKNAASDWKFGTAAGMLLRAVETGLIPGLAGIAKTLGTGAIETAIQAAYAVVAVSL